MEISLKQFTDYWLESYTIKGPLQKSFISKKKELGNAIQDICKCINEQSTLNFIDHNGKCGVMYRDLLKQFLSDFIDAAGVAALKPLWTRENNDTDFPLQELILQDGDGELAKFALDILISAKASDAAESLRQLYKEQGDERALAASQYLNLAFGIADSMTNKDGYLSEYYVSDSPRQLLSLLAFVNFLGAGSLLKFVEKYFKENGKKIFLSPIVKDSFTGGKINFITWVVREYGPYHRMAEFLCMLLDRLNCTHYTADGFLLQNESTYKVRLGSPICDTVKGEHAEHLLRCTEATWSGSSGDIQYFNGAEKKSDFLTNQFPDSYGSISLIQLAQCEELKSINISVSNAYEEIRDFLIARREFIKRKTQKRPQLTLNLTETSLGSAGISYEQMKILKTEFEADGVRFTWRGTAIPDGALPV
jgi:hypothetical protein